MRGRLMIGLMGMATLVAGMAYAESTVPKAERAATTAAAATNAVAIDNFSYTPKEITVAVGATVTWTNKDDVPHTVTSTSKPRTLNSDALDTDGTYSHTFKTAGTYPYYCTVHPHMTGTVIVK